MMRMTIKVLAAVLLISPQTALASTGANFAAHATGVDVLAATAQ
jgi:hypothetical protein